MVVQEAESCRRNRTEIQRQIIARILMSNPQLAQEISSMVPSNNPTNQMPIPINQDTNQGLNPANLNPSGGTQGTNPVNSDPNGASQGTSPVNSDPNGGDQATIP